MLSAPCVFQAQEEVGPYRLLHYLGSGAFGEVWQAERDASLGVKVKVALKLQDSRHVSLEAIKREVRVWSWVSGHSHILPLIGVEEYATRGTKYVGIASQFVAGGSLADWLERQPGRVAAWPSACRIVCGVLQGLEYMHGWRDADGKPAPIIHRDLKTANVLMNGDMPLLADLGLANIIEGSKDYRLSQHLSGTLSYMPPEALDGRVSPRMDIWAAGVILYKLLSGRVPFDQPDRTSLIKAIIMNDVPPLPVIVPDSVRRVVEQALQKEESQRYQTATAMRAALEMALSGTVPATPLPADDDTLPDYEFQQRQMAQRLAEMEAKHREAEAEAARLRAQVAAHQQAQDAEAQRRQNEATQQQARIEAEKQRQLLERQQQREAEERQQAQQREAERQSQRQAEARRQAEQERQRQAAQQQREAEERRKQEPQPQPFTTIPTPAPTKSVWDELGKLVGFGAAVFLGVVLLAYKFADPNATSSTNSPNPPVPTPTITLSANVNIEMVKIPAGKFLMGAPASEAGPYGDEALQHKVTISKPFLLGKYEVTQEQWQAVMGNNPSKFEDCPKCPVESVSWDEAQQFIAKLNAQAIGGGGKYRLPTEAEWEYAARAGSVGPYYGDLDAIAWYGGNSGDKTHPVGQKQANKFGLYDMQGNVREWVQDWYGPYNSGAVSDPSGPSKGLLRVLRGGSWIYLEADARSAFRGNSTPGIRSDSLGFRLVRTPS